MGARRRRTSCGQDERNEPYDMAQASQGAQTNSHRRNGLSKMKEYKIPSNVVRDVKQSAPSVGRVLWEIIDSNCRKEESRRMGFVKTYDAKCCEFMRAGGMFYCGEITTCPYYNKRELDRK